MYRLQVYFHGPQTNWSGKIAGPEVIAQHEVPFLWLARFRARRILADLNTGRCGYVIAYADRPIELFEAPHPELAG